MKYPAWPHLVARIMPDSVVVQKQKYISGLRGNNIPAMLKLICFG
jgi:hypothetical protein